jgi:catechol 2,3-dioxygenase-like lactoylglutathione lyase family enzyme
MAMERRLDVPQRVDVIELRVPDLDNARHFYLYGMGWMPVRDAPPDATVIDLGGGMRLALAGPEAPEAGVDGSPESRRNRGAVGPGPMTLVVTVASEEQVTRVVDLAGSVGGTVLVPPERTRSGAFHGYFADPAGFRWEVTTEPPAA